MAWWIDAPDVKKWLGPYESQDEAIEKCITWCPASTVRWRKDE